MKPNLGTPGPRSHHGESKIAVIALAVGLGTMLAKGYYLGRHIFSEPFTWQTLSIFYNDLSLLGLVLFFAFAPLLVHNKWIAALSRFFLSACVSWYLLESVVTIQLDARPTIAEVFLYSRELGTVTTAFQGVVLPALMVVALTFFGLEKVQRNRAGPWIFSALGLIAIPPLDSVSILRPYAVSIIYDADQRVMVGEKPSYFSPQQLSALHADRPLHGPLKLGPASPNIVMVIIESWSAVDSYATSGIRNLTPRIDAIARDGTLFTNFYANGTVTEHGLASFFSGAPPIMFPGGPWRPVKGTSQVDSMIRAYRTGGYRTHLITSADASFMGKSAYLNRVGFEWLDDVNTVPALASAPKFAFGGAPDETLYGVTLAKVREMASVTSPFFLVAETTSSHLPYTDPKGRGNTEENVWDYVDESLDAFYRNLRGTNFFDNGILVVTSDHHKRLAPISTEFAKYGESSRSRIPLVIIGHGIERDRVDRRLLQQTDLLAFLGDLVANAGKTTFSSDFALCAGRYKAPLTGENWDRARVYLGSSTFNNGFPARTLGHEFLWESTPPSNSYNIVRQIQAIRARLQACNSDTRPATCG